jgi:putative Ca2+/H+ antiporter (TMEM165/GDT1 family)
VTVFWLSAGLVFLAEMGDKTQFATAALATRYSARLVLGALTIATLVSHLLSVYLGRAAHLILPQRTIGLVAGLAFIAFGIWTLRADASGDEEQKPTGMRPFVALMLTFFVTEMGDKTMLATVAIAVQYPNVVAVWLGSTLGMLIADGLAIVAGRSLAGRVPQRVTRFVAAAIFLVTGVLTIVRVLFYNTPGPA